MSGRVLPPALRLRAAALDLALYRLVRSPARVPALVSAARLYSTVGEHGAGWVALGLGGGVVDTARRRRWLRATAGVAGSYALSTTVKVAVGRRRPAVESLPALMATPTGLSFPSSHATSSFAAARAFGPLLAPRPLYALAAAMALARVYLGVHYPSDVAAGALLGTMVGGVAR